MGCGCLSVPPLLGNDNVLQILRKVKVPPLGGFAHCSSLCPFTPFLAILRLTETGEKMQLVLQPALGLHTSSPVQRWWQQQEEEVTLEKISAGHRKTVAAAVQALPEEEEGRSGPALGWTP